MRPDTLNDLLLWSMLLNYALLLLWFLVFSQAHDWLYRLHGRWFRLSPEQFDVLHYAGMMGYKLGIFLLNLAPLAALHLAGFGAEV